ncbi:protein kinase domain-containing protein [Penicillium canescens]|nr:protein kinase domain-containing protein [Penicillium canescens]
MEAHLQCGWLEISKQLHDHVVLKILTRGAEAGRGLIISSEVRQNRTRHFGKIQVRHTYGHVILYRAGSNQQCLILEPLWESLRTT